MGQAENEARLEVDAGTGVAPAELDSLTRQLRDELMQLGVGSVDLVGGDVAPEGTMGLPLVAIGRLVVNFAKSDAVEKVVGVIKAWLGRAPNRSIKISIAGNSIEMTGSTAAQQQEVIDAWIAAVTATVKS